MKRKLTIICFAICIIASIFPGCAAPVKSQSDTLSKEISDIREKNSELGKEIDKLKEKSSLSQKEIDGLNGKYLVMQEKMKEQAAIITMLKDEESSDKYSLLPIYTANSDTYEKDIGFYISISKNMGLKEKLDTIAKELSEFYFGNLPIEVLRIESVNGKKVAVVNLSESKENQGITETSNLKSPTWFAGFFQGSTGGSVTSTSLIETFLQREIKDGWIDGVRFLYNNEVCKFDHVPKLGDVNFR